MLAFTYVCACTSLVPMDIGEGFGSSGTRVINGCEPPRGHRKPNPSLLEEQQVLLSVDLAPG